MYGYQDTTPNAKDKKRRKQQEYQDALDRDAGKFVSGRQQQQPAHMLPQVNSKYKSKHDNSAMNQGAPLSMDVVMDSLNHFTHYMQTNDRRMRELENTIVMLESQGDQVQGNMAPPGGGGGDSKDSRKLKLRVDELQTILAAEIKSRNISERELEQQIISARENVNQNDDGGGGGGGLAKKVSELSDKLHRAEAALQMEAAERMELKKQVDAITSHENTVGSQLKKVQSDIEKEMFLNKVGADERKRQLELIRDTESKIVESKQKLTETDNKRIESHKESRRHMDFLEKQIAEQGDTFQHALKENGVHIEQVAATMQVSLDKAVGGMEKNIQSFEDKVLLMEKNLHATLSESLRSLHTDLRIEREMNSAQHQEMKEVLSAEITSRRKAVGKTNANVDKLFVSQEETVQNLQILKANVDENVKDINASLCKIAGGFSEQLITLQEVTKTAVRTLQIDQVSLTAKLRNSIIEYKQLYKLLEDRANDCDSHITSVEASLKSQSKKLNGRIDDVDGKLEEKSSELGLQIEGESKKREEAVRKMTDTIHVTIENCISRMNDLASEFDSKINSEATSRSNAISNAEKRQQDCLVKQGILTDDKMGILKETVDNEISFAISIENQTRTRNAQKMSKLLQSQMKTLAETTNELVAAESKERSSDLLKTNEALQTIQNETSYAISMENQTRSISIQKMSKSLTKKHDDFIHNIRIDSEEKDLRDKQARRRLQRRLAREAKGFTETDENLREIILINKENHKCEVQKLEEKLSSGLATEIEDVTKSMVKSSSDVLLEVDRKEVDLLKRLKVELMEQLLASHVKAQSHRQSVEHGMRNMEVRSCLDKVVNTIVESNVMESFGSKFDAVASTTSSDTTEAKAYVDMATKFLDKKLMAGFDDYNKRLAKGLADVRKDVHTVSDDVLGQVEKNDNALLGHLKKIHAKSNQHRHQLEEALLHVEVSSAMDRIVSTIVDNDNDSAGGSVSVSTVDPSDVPENWETQKDEKSGRPYYYNHVTDVTQWDLPKCLNAEVIPSSDSAVRESITSEIDLKINAVGIEVLDRVQKLQLRQKEAEDLLQSYDLPVLLDSVSSLRHDLADTAEELQSVREELSHITQQGKELANAME